MMGTIRQLYGKTLAASDGDVGQIKDFYFNDQQWAVRYVIVNTGSWLPGRQVLLSPHAFRSVHQKEDSLQVILTRQQIENSPAIESQKPVSRQHEEEYYGFGAGDPHLRSARSLSGNDIFNGYQIQTSEGTIGHVTDFVVDDKIWAIHHLVVKIGRLSSRKEAVISPQDIFRISYEESKVFVKATGEAI
jgi:sporulation protein YlmC with PRC-barrel domain